MFRSLHVAATGMSAQQTNLDTISNNIANANTSGYKQQRVDFQDLLYQTLKEPGAPTGPDTQNPTGLQVGTGVRVAGTSRVFRQGTMLNTNNPLDVAVEGDGFFMVQQPNGELAYTRASTFQTDSSGRVVNTEGLPLDPPVTIPEGATSVNIGADGRVSVTVSGDPTPVEIGQIQLATFLNPAGLKGIGHNLMTRTEASGEAQVGEPGMDGRGALLQGAVEQSNVNIVEEMIGLITSQRAYEVNSKVITTADEMLRAATQLR